MNDQKELGRYLALIPIVGALAVSFAVMIIDDEVTAGHYNLRGPTLAARAVPALIATPVLALPWLVTAWFFLRRNSRSQRIGACLFVATLTLPGAWFLVDIANVKLDQPKPTTYIVEYVRYVRPIRSKDPGFDVVTSWRKSGETIALTRTIPGSRRPGQRLELDVHEGALGFEYVTSVRDAPPPDNGRR